MDKSIFRSYDIRGIYPEELSESDAFKIGKAITKYLDADTAVVGRDVRLAAPAISQAIQKGFRAKGAEVVDIGLCSTDMLYFGTAHMDADCGVMITASHNPKEWIGMKICGERAKPVGGDGEIVEIGEIAFDLDAENMDEIDLGSVKKQDLMDEWLDHVQEVTNTETLDPMTIAVDAGNGVAGPIIEQLAQRLPLEIKKLYFRPDGSFPNHLPNPIEPENLKDLKALVRSDEEVDLGMAFDGDADRVFLVDEKGETVTGTVMTALILEAVLKEDSDRFVIINTNVGYPALEVIEKYGADWHRSLVGHGYIKKDMAEYGGFFAGEHSGHYFFKDNFNADSALIAAMYVLRLLSEKEGPASEVFAPYRKYPAIPETNFEIEKDAEEVIDKLQERYQDGKQSTKDGLTVRYDDWWFNVRPSSNEPLLRLNMEAKDENMLEEKKSELVDFLSSQ